MTYEIATVAAEAPGAWHLIVSAVIGIWGSTLIAYATAPLEDFTPGDQDRE